MSLIRYTHPMMHLQQQINRMFDQFDTDLFGRLEGLGEGMFTPPVDIKKTPTPTRCISKCPASRKDNLHLSLQDNVLTIKGSKEQKQESGEGRYRRIERSYGSFSRSLSLPRNVTRRASKRTWKTACSKCVCPSAKNRSRARSTLA
jgi:HSP20 family protein